MSKHTPGPWFVIEHKNADCVWTVQDKECGGGHAIALRYMIGPRDDEDVANARLIAAAPEMLEALKAIDQAIMIEGKNANLIRAAIAKAECQTP